MFEPVHLERTASPQIAAFSRVACPYDILSTDSVDRAIFGDDDPQLVVGIYDGGLDAVGVGVVRGERAWIKLLAVHPRMQRRRMGTALLDHLEEFCRAMAASTIDVGTSAPWYVAPGIDVRSTEAICFFEARGYRRIGEAVNLGVRLGDLPEPRLPCHTATVDDLSRIRPWVEREHPHWIAELERAVDLGTCVVHDDVGFAAYDVNRDGWFGPIASRRDVRGRGVGCATLREALRRMRASGYERAEIAWATALSFYVKTVGARISRVFWCYRKEL